MLLNQGATRNSTAACCQQVPKTGRSLLIAMLLQHSFSCKDMLSLLLDWKCVYVYGNQQ